MNGTNLIVPRALLLDADLASGAPLRAALDRRGFDVTVAAEAREGVALLLETLLALDVLVVDADLAGRNAEGFLHLVRAAGGERELGIVVVASGLDGARRRALLALGADAVVDRRQGVALVAEAAAAAASLAAARRAGTSRDGTSPFGVLLDAVGALAGPPAPQEVQFA